MNVYIDVTADKLWQTSFLVVANIRGDKFKNETKKYLVSAMKFVSGTKVVSANYSSKIKVVSGSK